MVYICFMESGRNKNSKVDKPGINQSPFIMMMGRVAHKWFEESLNDYIEKQNKINSRNGSKKSNK